MFAIGGLRPKILLVDDMVENLFATRKVLESLGAEILTATSGPSALNLLGKERFALVILDVQMPDMDGFEVASMMRRNVKTKDIPIIFLTALDKALAHKGFEIGASDYICKPVEPDALRAKVSFYLRFWRARAVLDPGRCA